ncbi:MAG TPA: hypothetical protein VIM41_09685 [Gammaproteobacteria bacterium]
MASKTVSLELTRSAHARLEALQQPLTVELELYFSCMIRLRVVFPEQPGDGYFPVAVDNEKLPEKLTGKLKVYFHPVMTKHCVVDDIRGRAPDTVTFPIKKPEKFIPRWLKLDFKHGNWCGKFGY